MSHRSIYQQFANPANWVPFSFIQHEATQYQSKEERMGRDNGPGLVIICRGDQRVVAS